MMSMRLPFISSASAVSMTRVCMPKVVMELHVHLKHAAHIGLGLFAGDKVLVGAGLAGHFVQQGDGLGLGGDDVVVSGARLRSSVRSVR
jgi:hypothetical protein